MGLAVQPCGCPVGCVDREGQVACQSVLKVDHVPRIVVTVDLGGHGGQLIAARPCPPKLPETSFELLSVRGARYEGFCGGYSTCFDFIWVCINETGASKCIKEAPFSLAVSYLAS